MFKSRKLIVCVLLAVSAVFILFGCSGNGSGSSDQSTVSSGVTEKDASDHSAVIDLNTEASDSASEQSEALTENETDLEKLWEKMGITTTEAPTTAPKTTKPAQSKKVTGSGFFDDAVFVGDSVTMGLRNYVTSERNNGRDCLGQAQFLCSGSMGYSNTLFPLDHKEGIHPKVNGEKVFVEDGVKELGGKKVFIMLGMNDYCLYDYDTAIGNAEKLVANILKKNPDCEIYIQSVTPVIAAKETKKFNNENIDLFNDRLEDMCSDNGWTYIDINSMFKDDNNKFNDSYCSDKEAQGIHLSMAGCKVWADYLMNEF